MGREKYIRNLVLNAVIVFTIVFSSCEPGTYADEQKTEDVRLTFATGELATKSEDPDENKVTDISLMIFDDYGVVQRTKPCHGNVGGSQLQNDSRQEVQHIRLCEFRLQDFGEVNG